MDPIDNTYRFFHYYPNKPLAIVGAVIFGLFTLYLPYRIIKSRSRVFLYILPITVLMECIGYILRYLCAQETTLIKYVLSTLFLLLPPNALALVNYKSAGEIIRLSNAPPTRFYLRPKFVTWFFFWSDIFVFFLQGGGGGLQVTSSANLGRILTIIGLAIQLVFLACYGFILVHIGRNSAYDYHAEGQTNPKKPLIRCLFITLILLYIRSIYRFAEYAAGYDGPIATAEWAFYVFDGLVITCMFIVYCVLFIGDYLPKRGEVEEASTMKISSVSSLDILNQAENGFEMHTANNKYNNV